MIKSERHRWWTATCEEFRRSEESQRDFCKERGLALSTLQYWLRKTRPEPEETKPAALVEVATVSGSMSAGKTLRIRGPREVTIELDLPVSHDDLRLVLEAVAAL